MLLNERTYVFLGAEGMSEVRDTGWVREVPQDETFGVAQAAEPWPEGRSGARVAAGDLTIDQNGRPYWLVELTSECPAPVRRDMSGRVRVLRLVD